MIDKSDIRQQFRRFILAYILTALSACLGNIVSSIIAGNMIGADAVSAINLSKPVTQLYYTLHLLLTAGSGMLVAYALGKNNREHASHIFTQAIVCVTIISVLFILLGGIVFPKEIVHFFCKNAELQSMTYDYMHIVLLGAPFYMLVNGLSTMVAVDGEPRLVSVAILIDNAVNLLLAPLFIGVFNMGVASSSVAVIVGHCVGIGILMLHWRNKDSIQFQIGDFIKEIKKEFAPQIKHILDAGAPLAIASICLTLLLYAANSIVLGTLGKTGIFVFSVCMNLLLLYNLFLSGSCSTLQSLGAIQVGKNDRDGLRYVIRKTLRFLTIAMIVICAFVCIFPEVVTSIFGGGNDPELIAEANHALRIFAISFIPFCYIYVVMIIFKLLKHDGLALFISFALSLTVIIVLYIISKIAPDLLWYSYLIAYGIEILAILLIMKIRHISFKLEIKNSNDNMVDSKQ